MQDRTQVVVRRMEISGEEQDTFGWKKAGEVQGEFR